MRYCLVSAFFGSIRIGHQRSFVELLERRHHRQAADELGDQTVLDQIFRLDVVEHIVAMRTFVLLTYLGHETDAASSASGSG